MTDTGGSPESVARNQPELLNILQEMKEQVSVVSLESSTVLELRCYMRTRLSILGKDKQAGKIVTSVTHVTHHGRDLAHESTGW